MGVRENMDAPILYWTSVKAIILAGNAEICISRGRRGKDRRIAKDTESRGGTLRMGK